MKKQQMKVNISLDWINWNRDNLSIKRMIKISNWLLR